MVKVPICRGSTLSVFPYHRYGPQRVAQPVSTPSKDALWSAHEDGRRERCSYCKPYGKGQDAVLNYLARYVFRVALTNRRLMAMDETHVTLRYKDHDTDQWRTIRLEGVQFLRRFLFHVLPKGFHKVRYYGLWHPCKRDRQARARLLLELTTPSATPSPAVLMGDIVDKALEQSALASHMGRQ